MIKLVAVGNRLMMDDGIAIRVAEELRNRFTCLQLDIIIGETDCHSSFYLLNDNDFVIILDAMYMGEESGSVHVFSLDALSNPSGSCTQHDMSILELMRLYNCKFKGCIIGIEVADIGFGDCLSPVLMEKFPKVCSEVESVIKNIILEETGYA
mgnify:CR=1 FL=1